MKIDFNDITTVSKQFECVNDGWFTWGGAVEQTPVQAKFTIVKKSHDTVAFDGELTGAYVIGCDRCGVEVAISLASEFSYLVTTREEVISELPEVECDFDDLMTVYVTEPVIDTETLLSEQAELAIPLQIVCCDDCKGLCSGCGASLNSEKCQCDPNDTDSPFAVLKKLSQR